MAKNDFELCIVANEINDFQLTFEIQNYAADTFYTVHFAFDFCSLPHTV